MARRNKKICRCGKDNPPSSQFCTTCGRPLDDWSNKSVGPGTAPREFTEEEKRRIAHALVEQWRGVMRWYDTQSVGLKRLCETFIEIELKDMAPKNVPRGIAAPMAFWFLETSRYYLEKALD